MMVAVVVVDQSLYECKKHILNSSAKPNPVNSNECSFLFNKTADVINHVLTRVGPQFSLETLVSLSVISRAKSLLKF